MHECRTTSAQLGTDVCTRIQCGSIGYTTAGRLSYLKCPPPFWIEGLAGAGVARQELWWRQKNANIFPCTQVWFSEQCVLKCFLGHANGPL